MATLSMTLSDHDHPESPFLTLWVFRRIFGRAKLARVFKFCILVSHIKDWPWDDKVLPNRRGYGLVASFKYRGLHHIFKAWSYASQIWYAEWSWWPV